MKSITAQCWRARKQERERIACLLHDELGQHIALMRLKLSELRSSRQQSPNPLLDELHRLLVEAGNATRELTLELSSPAQPQDLLPTLRSVAEKVSQYSGLAVEVAGEQAGLNIPPRPCALACRIVRELCLNALKHACARQVRVTAALHNSVLEVQVQDDGQGLRRPPPAVWRARPDGGFGLASAQAQLRAVGGELSLESAPGGVGTCARFVLPLQTTPKRLTRRTT